MILSFYTLGSPTIALRLKMDESKSSLIEQLNETTRLAVTLTAPFAPALKVGMYTTYNGSDYYLIAEPSVTKVHNESYIIEADLESIAGLTKATILSNPIDKRTSFDYTATAREHLQLIADSLNLKLTNGGLKWAVGSVNCRNDVRHIKYDHVTTWVAIQRIRETYKTDISINGTTISLGIPGDKADALELSYGKDKGLLSGLERVKHSDTPTPSRLYVTGTKRNLAKGTLTLEPSQVLKIDDTGLIQRITIPGSGRVYTTDTDGRYVEIYTTDTTHLRTEATYTNEEIYPSHVSKVTTVEKVRDHYEVNSDLDLDYNKQTIAGEQMQIVFQSGNLAGREFDAVYKPSTKRFIITPKEEDETTLPNDILCPKAGDRYIITGIELPQQYIAEAQKKLTDAAVTQLEELQNTRYSYKAEVDPVYLYNNRTAIADKLTVGKYVHLTDTQIAQGDPYIRITSKRTYLDRIYQPEIELSNEVEEYSFFERLKDSFIDIARIDRKGELVRINRQMPDRMKEKIKGDTELQELLKGRDGKDAGRNLLLNSGDPRFQDGRCAVYELAYPIDKEGVYFLSFDVAFDKNQLYTPYGYRMKVILGYQTALETTGYIDYYESLHKGYSRLRLNVTKNSTYQGGAKTIYIYPNEDYENPDTDPRCGKFTIKNVMLEYGTKPTVWSPAPEDFLAELDKYTTVEQYKIDRADDKRELDKKLDKPTNGNYVLDKDIASQIGGLMKVGGRNLFREKYFAGDLASCFRIPFEAVTPRAEYNTYTLSFDYKISADDKASSPRVSITYKTQAFVWDTKVIRDGAWHHKVITFNLEKMDESEYPLTGWLTDYSSSNGRTIDMVAVRNIKLERGNVATDWTPAPEDTQSEIKDLQQFVPTKDQKDWLNKMGQVLKPDVKEISGGAFSIGGLSIDRSVFLRFSGDTPSALIGGHGSKAMLMAGVQDYGTSNQSAQMEIYQDGSAKFGAVKMLHNGMLVENDFVQMAFDKKAVREPLLISDTQPEFVESLSQSSVENRNVVSGANVYLTNSTRTRQYNFSTSKPSTKMTITIERVRCEVYPRNCVLEMLVDGVQIMSWRGDISYEQVDGSDFAGGGTRLNIHKIPSEETNISIEYMLPRGTHTLLLRNTSTDSTDKGTFYGLKCNLYYDASKGSTILSASGFRAYTNNSRYFDIDRREKYVPPSTGGSGGDDDLVQNGGEPNPYIARARGGMLLDRLTLEQPLDAPGCVLAGGRVENGYVRASFGKYKNRRGDSQPIARFDNSDKIYCVFHSIGNTNYTPIVTSCAGAWGDVPQVIGVYEYRFDVRFINYNNEPSVGWNFNYVCYKGE